MLLKLSVLMIDFLHYIFFRCQHNPLVEPPKITIFSRFALVFGQVRRVIALIDVIGPVSRLFSQINALIQAYLCYLQLIRRKSFTNKKFNYIFGTDLEREFFFLSLIIQSFLTNPYVIASKQIKGKRLNPIKRFISTRCRNSPCSRLVCRSKNRKNYKTVWRKQKKK